MKCVLKRLGLLFGVLLLGFSLSACGQSGSQKTKSTQVAKTKVIIDQANQKVTIPKKVKRVAVVGSIWPLPSVMAVYFNSADKIVTMPKPSMVAAKNSLLSELYPDILKAKTSFNDGTDVNTEELKKLKPDVVFYGAEDTKLQKKLTNAGFAAVGIAVSKWNCDTIKTQNHWIDLLSKVFPEDDKAKVLKDYSQEITQRIQKRTKSIKPADRQRIFFLRQYSDTAIVTGGTVSFGQYWADAINAKNVVDIPNSSNVTKVTMEQIYQWNPQHILVTNFNSAMPEDLYQNTVGHYNWQQVAAVQNKQVTKMPMGMYRSYTPGVDTPITLLWLAKTVYPDKFQDVNMVDETKTYYKKVFNIDLTDKQADRILKPDQSTW